jgi:hypothetical protein
MTRKVGDGGTVRTETFVAALDDIDSALANTVHAVGESVPEHALLIEQAAWYGRGLVYHCRAMYAKYQAVAAGVSGRAQTGASVIVMHSPEMQELLFEFYAFVLLGRLTLDELRTFVAPTFATRLGELPKSINGMLDGTTDCPLYASFLQGNMELVRYLIELRDCVVHYRSFATSDNPIAVLQGFDPPEAVFSSPWHEPVTRVQFRHVPATGAMPEGIAVNILLPDAIFTYGPKGNRGKMVERFTYNEGINLMTQCREFSKLLVGGIVHALVLLRDERAPVFTWRKS